MAGGDIARAEECFRIHEWRMEFEWSDGPPVFCRACARRDPLALGLLHTSMIHDPRVPAGRGGRCGEEDFDPMTPTRVGQYPWLKQRVARKSWHTRFPNPICWAITFRGILGKRHRLVSIRWASKCMLTHNHLISPPPQAGGRTGVLSLDSREKLEDM